MNRQRMMLGMAIVLAAAGWVGCRADSPLTEVQRVSSGGLEIALLSARDALHLGKDTFTIEFRSASDRNLVDVGAVKVAANMPMPGMPMFATIDVQPGSAKGRYTATSDFSMAGTWRLTLEWDGPAGRGTVTFSENVQ